MELSEKDRRLLAALEDGLPLVARPYAALAAAAGLSEDETLDLLRALQSKGVINRFGVIVKHRALGYDANAMVVWDVPDGEVAEAGERLARLPYITLCYRRPRRLPDWPYNLFCMIHGRDRDIVEKLAGRAAAEAGLEARPHTVLFSRRCFKQRGARYAPRSATPHEVA